MRCGRCGNENADANRFCGMCGAPLALKNEPAAAPTVNVATPRQPAAPPGSSQTGPVQSFARPASPAIGARPLAGDSASGERRTAPSPVLAEPKTAPVITGPSFLGLSTPGPASHRQPHSADERDHLQPSPGNLDYLLEDEEPPKRGKGMAILLVLAVLLAGGFGYLRYQQGGFDWLIASHKKAATPAADGQNADFNASNAPASAPIATDGSSSQPGPTSGRAPSTGAAATPPDSSDGQANASQPAATQSTAPNAGAERKAADSDAAAQAVNPDSEHSSPAETTAAAPARRPAPAKSAAAKPTAGRPFDVAAEADRYIYGRGVRQDCEHGLHLLKPAAERSDVKAMISLGVLYSTGTCTPRDLPTAYRWFALALHKQPDNQALQDDLKNLWEKMTPPERQLAIKLSQ